MLFTSQVIYILIHSTLNLAEVMSIASLLEISSMQCNIWCAELLFQKVKNYLSLIEEET